MNRILELETLIRHHNHLYYTEDKPTLIDTEYDKLVDELRSLDPKNELFSSVGAPVKGTFKKVKHSMPLLSLNKATTIEEILKWLGPYNFIVVQPKIDGLSIALRYEEGKLVQAITRGDGLIGDDVTEQAKTIKDIPHMLKQKVTIEVRGEVYMKHSVFENLKIQGKQGVNCRNMAAGSLRQKDPDATEKRKLSFAAHDIINGIYETEQNKMNVIEAYGIMPVRCNYILKNGLQKEFNLWENQREILDYDLDGIVLKFNDCKIQKKLGADYHAPKWAIAWKFKAEQASTILKEVEWNIGREGALTAVAIFDPIQCAGATITRASLHSADMIEKLGVNIGDKIIVSRRGDVIPYVEGIIEKNTKGTIAFPKVCPSCEGSLIRDGAFLFCRNKECQSQTTRAFDHWKQETGMDFLGKKTIRLLIKEGLLKDVADLYMLKDKREKYLALERMGERSVDKVLTTIENARKLKLNVFLAALGIESLGTRIGIKLAEKFKTLERVRKTTTEEIDQMEGFGDIVANDIVGGLKEKSDLIDKLLRVGVKVEKAKEAKQMSISLQGKRFCITGELENFSREEAENKIREHGGTIASVNAKLDYLVTNTSDSGTGKNKKADELGIKKITEKEFVKML